MYHSSSKSLVILLTVDLGWNVGCTKLPTGSCLLITQCIYIYTTSEKPDNDQSYCLTIQYK